MTRQMLLLDIIPYNFLFHMGLVEIEHGPLNRAEEQF